MAIVRPPSLVPPQRILNFLRLPGRIDAGTAADLLGFSAHDIPVLTRGKLLKPLGSPAHNSVKYFSAVTIEALARDEAWLARATRLVNEHWRGRNQRKTEKTHGVASEYSGASGGAG